MSDDRVKQLLEQIETAANGIFPLIRQIQQQGPHTRHKAIAVRDLDNGLSAFMGIHLGEAKQMWEMGPAEIRSQNGQKGKIPAGHDSKS